VVGPILKQHHRTVRLAWTRARLRWRLHCSLNNFELRATIMTNSSPDHNTSASKMVGLVHAMVHGMNSVDVFAALKVHGKHYRSCVMHLCTNGTTSHKPLSLLQEVVTHVTELRKPPYYMTISVVESGVKHHNPLPHTHIQNALQVALYVCSLIHRINKDFNYITRQNRQKYNVFHY
jgi:hypothetical protein